MQELGSRSSELDEQQRDYHGSDKDKEKVRWFIATLLFFPIKKAEVFFLFAISFCLHDIPHLLLVHLFAYYSCIQFSIIGIRVKNAGKLYSFVSS